MKKCNKILGNLALMERLDSMINGGRFFHACIISGEGGTGKRTLAAFLSAAAVCTGDHAPCGECEGCRKAEGEIHPDIEAVERQGAELVVAQIRAVRGSVYSPPNEAPRRVVIINEAETMNLSAQNAFLNILEEPPTDVLFILLTENENALLPTVRSRCVRLRLSPLTREETERELAARFPETDREKIVFAASRAGGRLGKALELVEGAAEPELAYGVFTAYLRGDRREILRQVPALEKLKREDWYIFLQSFKEQLKNSLSAERAGTGDEKGLRDRRQIALVIEQCDKLYGYLEANVGTGLAAGRLVSLLLAG